MWLTWAGCFWIASTGMILALMFFMQGRHHFPETPRTAETNEALVASMPQADDGLIHFLGDLRNDFFDELVRGVSKHCTIRHGHQTK